MSMAQVLRLKPAFSDEQVLATKRDIAGLGSDLERTKFELRAETDKLRAELKADIDKLRLEVQRDLKATEARLVVWVVGQGAATIGILFALLHFVGK